MKAKEWLIEKEFQVEELLDMKKKGGEHTIRNSF
jgi:hypothetical protein